MAEYNKIQNIHLKYINLYLDRKFEDQVSQVFQIILARLEQELINKPQKRTLEAITNAATRIIEGLYQVYGSRNNNCGLGVPTSKSGYGKKPYQIDDLSHTAIIRVLDALQSLGWIKRRRGIKNWDGECISTSIKPFGGLLKLFQKTKYVWRPLAPAKQGVIVLKGYDPVTKIKEIQSFKYNNQIRHWRKNLETYNKFLTQHAICLSVENHNLDKMIKSMLKKDYQVDWMLGEKKKKPRTFNFLHVQLRRIFARGNFQHGGRFYGGWWQFIPSEYRSYITINGQPTVEIDYSELHPRLIYLTANQPIPEGDLYDLGLRYDGIEYDKEVEPYKSKRKIIKNYVNAVINDEKGTYKLHGKVIREFGMNTRALEELVVKRHPLIKEIKGKGLGLKFQFIDSQVAELVMMRTMSKGILCLPVHDSFICQAEHLQELRQVMEDAYSEVINSTAKIKDPEMFKTDFEPVFYPSGALDFTYMKNLYSSVIHEEFLSTFYEHSGK
jgi:hypothetical protein